MSVPQQLSNVLRADPQIMHGKPCFAGTRVPVSIFLANVSEGMGLDEFLDNYPSVRREQAAAVLEWLAETAGTLLAS